MIGVWEQMIPGSGRVLYENNEKFFDYYCYDIAIALSLPIP